MMLCLRPLDVTPAQAGGQPMHGVVDSRLRGNDVTWGGTSEGPGGSGKRSLPMVLCVE
jgi:hypothetical protein